MLYHNYYNYAELRNKAISNEATQADIDAFGEWFSMVGHAFWNGEYFDADDGYRLYPIYVNNEEDNFDVIGYEFK